MIAIEVANQQSQLSIEADTLRRAVDVVLKGEGVDSAAVSVAVVDDETIHDLNRRFLEHDYPTDVLSFVLSESGATLDGEVVVSAETALRRAANYSWSPAEELLLYLVHGTLHLVGYEDASDQDRALMREKERAYLLMLESDSRERDNNGEPSQSVARHATGGERLL